MLSKGWSLEKVASGNLSIQTFDNDKFEKIGELKKILQDIYGERIKEGTVHEVQLMMDEYFQDVYIDDIRFNIGDEFGIICFMTYEESGNKYILEIYNHFNSLISHD